MRRRKLLIADDSEMNRAILANVLDQEFEVIEATNGQEVIIALQSYGTQISALLLDIVMPEMDGYEVLQHLKSNPETTDIPVIIMSALSDMQSIVKGYELGATEYVTKPFQREELVKRVAHRYELYSIKRIKDGNIAADVARDTLAAVQTPQVFRKDLLRRALTSAAERGYSFTDDCAAVESLGTIVKATHGSYQNIKITTPEDILVAEALLTREDK